MTALSEIFGEIDTRLGMIPGVQEYERMPAGDPVKLNALRVFDSGDEPASGETNAQQLEMRFTVEGHVAGSGAAAHDAMLLLHAAVVRALCGDAGENLGGLVESIAIDGRRRVANPPLQNKPRMAFGQDFLVTFATPRGNPLIFA